MAADANAPVLKNDQIVTPTPPASPPAADKNAESDTPEENVAARPLPDPNSNISGWLAFTVTAGFLIVVAAAYFQPFPEKNTNLLNVLLGALGTAFITVVNFYFGSSAGSKAKDIANLALLKSTVEKSQV